MAKKKKTEHNLYWEAFINQYNLIGLAGLVALSIVLQSWLPFMVAIALELMYIALLPETQLFQRTVENKYREIEEDERRRRLQNRLDRLHPVQQRRYEEISARVDTIRDNLKESDQNGLDIESKLEVLRDRYLWLMELLNAYDQYLGSMRPNQIEDALRDVEQQIATHQSERVRATLEERRDVLQKRKQRLERVHENHAIVRTQVMTVEDIMRLIHESSMTIQNPQDIGRQIDDLLIDVEATEEAVHDLDAIGNVAAQDELAAFDQELEQAIHQVEMEVRSR